MKMKINFELVKDRSVVMYGDNNITPDKIFPTVEDFVDFLNLPMSIIDEDERRYLKHIVRPFYKSITSITKHSIKERYDNKIYEYLTIEFNEINGRNGDIFLPYFVPNTMYKGMTLGEHYTLDDLGITFKK